MRVLVAWGSKAGGTEGIAQILGAKLRQQGLDVVLQEASVVRDLRGYDGVIVGGALYANRWHQAARRLVMRNLTALRQVPVWLFSSGLLDDSAGRHDIPPTVEVATLMQRVGALGHATFGGRLKPDAKGFPASAMAKKLAGDWRDPGRIEAWAAVIAAALPTARAGVAIDPPGGSIGRLLAYGVAGWAACGIVMGAMQAVAPLWLALTLHAIAAPLIFVALSVPYFRAPGARQPLPTALAFTAIVVVLDAVVVAGLILRSADMFTTPASIAGTWLPFVLIFAATLGTGTAVAMIPAPAARQAKG